MMSIYASCTMQRFIRTPVGVALIRLLIVALALPLWPLGGVTPSMAAAVTVSPLTAATSDCLHDGDVNEDGAITPADVVRVVLHFLGLADPLLTACQQTRANVQDPAESAVTLRDGLCIFRHFLGLASCLDNAVPVAVAGADQTVSVSDTVQLDGSTSSDPDDAPFPLRFEWTLSAVPMGSRASLSDPTATMPTFIPDRAGTYTVELVVHDGRDRSAATVTIVAEAAAAPQPPILATVGDQTVALGSTLTLQLSAADPNGETLTFSARPLPLPDNARLDAMSGRFTFAPAAAQVGDLALTFTVSDGIFTAEETITITVTGAVAGGITALTGRVLDTNDFVQGVETPVVGAVVSLFNTTFSTTSNADGTFTLSGVPAGSQVLDIDTATANVAPDGSPYAGFREELTLIEGVTNVVQRPFFLPRLAMESLTTVNPATTTVVTNPTLGMSLEVPPNTARNADGSLFTGQLSISPVPESMAPAALPEGLGFGQLITIQPVGVTFDTPVPLTMPNTDNLPPGSELNLWSLDPETGTFIVVGTGRVSDDGTMIETIAGGVRAADWHGFLSLLLEIADLLNNADNQDLSRCIPCVTGSETHVNSGNLVVDHRLQAYRSLNIPRAMRLVYTSLGADPQPVIAANPTISVRAAVPPMISASLTVAGVAQGSEVFTDTGGLNENIDETIRQVIQFDASGFATGIYPYRLTSTSHYQTSSISTFSDDMVLVHNQRTSPFGAGWALGELQRLHLQRLDRLVLTEGNGSIQVFTDPQPEVTGAKTFDSPPGEFSTLERLAGGAFIRTLKNGTQVRFNARGLHTATVDRNGNTTTYRYDSAERLTSVEDPVGLMTTLTYTNGLLSSITDPAARTTTFMHNSTGDLTQIVSPDGSRRRFVYDGRHRMISQTSARDFDTTYAYDFTGRNTVSTLLDASTRRVSPGETFGLPDLSSGLGTAENPAPVVRPEDVVATFTDGNGNVKTFGTDRFGSATLTIDALGRQTVTSRDPNGEATRTVEPNGLITQRMFDDLGNLLSLREAVDTALERQIRFTYDDTFNQVTEATDRAGNVTTITYDRRGNPLTVTDPRGGRRTFTYDERGLPLTISDANGNRTTLAYDANGNPRTLTDALGKVVRINRDAAGNPTSLRENVGGGQERQATFTYDALNRLLSAVDPTGETTTLGYDAAGNVVEMTNDLGQTVVLTYDSMNRAISIMDPISGETTFTYDASGNRLSVVDARNQVTTFAYDAVNQLVRSVHALGGEETYTYDAVGNIVTFRDARGQTTTFTYDVLSRLIRQVNANGQITHFTYDPLDNATTKTNARGEMSTNTYDELSRLTQVRTADNTISRTYDALGNLLAIQDDDSRLTFSYDALNRVETQATVDMGIQPPVTLTHTYDVFNNRTRLVDSEDGTTRFAYDRGDRLASLTTPAGDVINLSYDQVGKLTRIASPNAVVSDYDYDADGRLTGLLHTANDDTVLAGFTYTYDALGVIENYSEQGVARTTPTPSATSFRYDTSNRLMEDSLFTYAYDANGNLVRKTRKDNQATTTYHWDAQDQLIQIDFADGRTATYRYDGLGRRIEKNVAGTITRYVYDGPDILLEYDGTGTLTARYSHGDHVDQPLSMARNGGRFFYHTDHLGSIRTLTDANGNVVNTYAYGAYGDVDQITEGVANPFTYTAREFDAESSLYYYRTRYYDPSTGRFLSEDTVGFANQSKNLYIYVDDNPVIMVDPSGEWVNILLGGVIGGVVGGVAACVFGDCSGKAIAKGFVSGAVSGALIGSGAGLVAGATSLGGRLLAGAAIGAGASAIGEVAGQATAAAIDLAFDCKSARQAFADNFSLGDVFIAGLVGAAGGAAGGYLTHLRQEAQAAKDAIIKQGEAAERALARPLPRDPRIFPQPREVTAHLLEARDQAVKDAILTQNAARVLIPASKAEAKAYVKRLRDCLCQ